MEKKFTYYYSSTFAKKIHKLPHHIKKKLIKKEKLIKQNIFHPNLRTHKLSGKLNNYWSLAIDYHYRISFKFINDHEILLLDVGTHSVYK